MQVTEQDSLSDLLMQEKEIFKVYGTFMTEGSSRQIRDVLRQNMDAVAEQQFSVFEAMQAKGYYETKPAENTAITEAKKSFGKKNPQKK